MKTMKKSVKAKSKAARVVQKGRHRHQVPRLDAKTKTLVFDHRKPISWTSLKVQRPPRPGSKRAAVLGLLRKKEGTTFEEIRSTVGWEHKDAYDGLRLINRELGFGIAEKNGRLRTAT